MVTATQGKKTIGHDDASGDERSQDTPYSELPLVKSESAPSIGVKYSAGQDHEESAGAPTTSSKLEPTTPVFVRSTDVAIPNQLESFANTVKPMQFEEHTAIVSTGKATTQGGLGNGGQSTRNEPGLDGNVLAKSATVINYGRILQRAVSTDQEHRYVTVYLREYITSLVDTRKLNLEGKPLFMLNNKTILCLAADRMPPVKAASPNDCMLGNIARAIHSLEFLPNPTETPSRTFPIAFEMCGSAVRGKGNLLITSDESAMVLMTSTIGTDGSYLAVVILITALTVLHDRGVRGAEDYHRRCQLQLFM
ncbi:hypothetical protein DOTSEDRAFT_24556 [Dothistroma septosporum NZE10]|uniref:Uncharacterized protein n=1 Tax=Dothistroma septosporum (strain NZE10 / CBS 128990) TaxID=675120 RepID=N1PM14_DOTSN|nr:hypothetical protein DOTSEDRAFT_24556 [Dothistroma septosporum NZE10]